MRVLAGTVAAMAVTAIRLNGAVIEHVTMADDETGEIEQYQFDDEGKVVTENNEPVTVKHTGVVEIVFSSDYEGREALRLIGTLERRPYDVPPLDISTVEFDGEDGG